MKTYVLETERCLLRQMDVDDAASIFRLNQHPDIYRFTTDPPFKSEDEALRFLKNYDPYSKTGFGRWAVDLKTTGVFIGWCGLKYIEEENEVDVGYRFLPEFWGKGFAVETANACCKWGFEVKGLKRIVARVHKENARSIRVAEKMNMVYEKDLMYDGVPWLNYVVPVGVT
ncbi:MAG: GNAT family N-acetyltransferase [Bacteroidota bacterium]|nr:GNAT family N-acetyltransferase [Bacteroidota bacterium]